MKKAMLLLAVLLALTASAQSNLTSVGADVELTLLNYEPVPARPGDVVDVWLKLANEGAEAKRPVSIEFIDNQPFELQSGEKRVHNVGSLPGGADYVAKFRVRVDETATAGTSYVTAKYSIGENTYRRLFFPIDIKSRISSLRINDVTSQPERFVPGGDGTLTFTMENIADSVLQNVQVKLDLEDSNAPLAPVGSSTERKIDELTAGTTTDLSFELSTEYDAEANVYRIPVEVSFTTSQGEEVSYNDLVGIAIAADPDLGTNIDAADIYTNQRTGTVTLEFVNRGVDEVKFLDFTLGEHDSYTLRSPSRSYYVGNIDSDDYEIQEIQLEAEQDTVTLPVTVRYSDAANKEYTTEETLTIPLTEQEQDSSSNTWLYVFLIALAIGGYWWWKRD
jgi:hypothetical protein